MTTIDAQTPIAITLSAEQWNGVLFVMGEAPVPYKLSAPLIQGIGQQMQTVAAAVAVQPRPNGQEHPAYQER